MPRARSDGARRWPETAEQRRQAFEERGDFDAALVDFICDDFEARNGISLREDRMALQKVREAAEQLTHQQLAEKFSSMNADEMDAYFRSL